MFAALSRSQPSAVSVLLAAKANVNHISGDGETALMLAAQSSNLTNVQLLLQASSDNPNHNPNVNPNTLI